MIGRREAPPAEETAKLKGFDDYDLRLGDVMRGERATMGKSLLDVQRELKIKAAYIAAIENADPTAFETQGFIAGYVRSYARYLGLDPEWAYARFCREGNFVTAHGMSPAASTARVGAPARARKPDADPFLNPQAAFVPQGQAFWTRIDPGALGSTLVLLLLTVVLGYGGWSVFREIQKVQFTPVDQAPGVASSVDVLSPGAVLAEAEDNVGLDVAPPDALDRLYRPQALDVPVLVARDGPIATLDPSTIGTLAPGVAPTVTVEESRIARAAPEPVLAPEAPAVKVVDDAVPEVRVFAVRPSWVRVQARDGTVIFEKILDAGESYVLPRSEEPPVLRAGNAGSVYFSVNGENFGPAGTGPSVVKNVSLAAEDLRESYAVADLTQDVDLARFVAVAEAQAEAQSD